MKKRSFIYPICYHILKWDMGPTEMEILLWLFTSIGGDKQQRGFSSQSLLRGSHY